MHPGFGLSRIQQEQQEMNNMMMENHPHQHNGTSSSMMNQNIVEQVIHHNLFMDSSHQLQHHPFLPVSHNNYTMNYPVNFKLGLNESSNIQREYNTTGIINGDFHHDRVLQEQETRHTSLEMHNQHCWPQDSSSIIKQAHQFWEPHPAEVSNENSEILDKLEKNIKMNLKLPYQRGSTSKPGLSYGELGELEAVYKRCGTTAVNQTIDAMLPCGQDQGSDGASIDASLCLKDDTQEDDKKKMKKKKRKGRASSNELVEFFEKLVKQVVDHQDNLYTKFVERMERLDTERRQREEAWRSRESVYFEQQAAARAHEKALAATRDAAIVSYLEKITGQNVPSLPSFHPNS